MRRAVTKHNKVAAVPAKAFVEVVREVGSSKESQTQYAPFGAPTGYVAPVIPTGANQALSGTGVLASVDLYSALTTVDTTGAATSVLSPGLQVGQLKTIRMIGDLGDCVITVAGDAVNSVTLNDTGDVCTLMWSGTGWSITDNVGCVIA